MWFNRCLQTVLLFFAYFSRSVTWLLTITEGLVDDSGLEGAGVIVGGSNDGSMVRT